MKTRIMKPPQDDLFVLFEESLTDLHEKDVVLISSKVVAIHQGRCVPIGSVNKADLVAEEAEYTIFTDYRDYPLTIKHHTFLGAAGIDESNSNEHYTLLPERPFETAAEIHGYLRRTHNINELGVIITDSRSQPFRYGATGVSLSFWGIEPLQNHIGKKDLFGREMKLERSNIIDGLASAAALVSGEVAECQPIVVARDVPDLVFAEGNKKNELMASPEDDTFRILYERFFRS